MDDPIQWWNVCSKSFSDKTSWFDPFHVGNTQVEKRAVIKAPKELLGSGVLFKDIMICMHGGESNLWLCGPKSAALPPNRPKNRTETVAHSLPLEVSGRLNEGAVKWDGLVSGRHMVL